MSETDTGIHWSYTGKDDTYHLYLHDKHVYATKDKRDLDMFAAELLAKMLPRESERDALRAEVERLVGLVMELTDAGECWYDHHGLCQAHSLQERPCPHSRAKDLLKAKGALSEAGK